ncbi:NO-inducible flavohemoprotein [Komagataeibacter rhaeticus]|uniref:nitric oxide dioxygenase n=1 Tax=Komagataeibacter rhaeticus TaxID=215221 RepID=A0A181CCS7_9PROT|nr:NO-inducible flavohemoprotein [Komagataeibacter rhaeticus]ATU74176.1 NO-inducible flavohemoprotein [Komagataeibacter xylinus]QIP36057.1 NO-inducible flavohemoprotein [Komagataeibacter rhaeticus]QOC45818.1 NO-inducible flavohemoprotein [Komagataeibacter rhaeticus]WPP21513.1 NO-inducible flavohemoprotein [Komagataeibacter rhaeticus]SAY49364.1 Flavohemoprotein [Komagataeibacter rhaeticus]
MALPLDDRTRGIIRACVPALEAHGLAITTEMYRRLLANPAIRDLFNLSHQQNGEQPRALALAVLAYARNIDNPGVMAGAVERIAEKHVGLNILPEHYPYVADALLGAIAQVLGDAATPDIMDAWGRAYWFLADILIGREEQIYVAHAAAPGGWTGWRPFSVRRRTVESGTVTSFELVPTDGRPVMRHAAGQSLGFRLDVPGHGPARRNYSISSAPGADAYRISVRRIDGGVVSNWLHDSVREGTVLQVSAPAGDFTLGHPDTAPVVFLSAGVGLTPFMSMLGVVATGKTPIRYIHATRSTETEAFGIPVRDLAAKGRLDADIFYTRQAPQGVPPVPNVTTHAGRITPEWLSGQVDPAATYYVCGPDGFMRDMVTALRAASVPDGHIRYAFFGPADDTALMG